MHIVLSAHPVKYGDSTHPWCHSWSKLTDDRFRQEQYFLTFFCLPNASGGYHVLVWSFLVKKCCIINCEHHWELSLLFSPTAREDTVLEQAARLAAAVFHSDLSRPPVVLARYILGFCIVQFKTATTITIGHHLQIQAEGGRLLPHVPDIGTHIPRLSHPGISFLSAAVRTPGPCYLWRTRLWRPENNAMGIT